MNLSFQEIEDFKPYHGERKWRPDKDGSRTPLEERPFISWDGEGGKSPWICNSKGEITRSPQPYILLMCALPNGDCEYIKDPDSLSTIRILNFMLDVEERFPDAFHVAYGFGYDINQICRSLSKDQLKILHKTGFVYICMRTYRIQWRKGKSLTITRYYSDGRKTSLTIYDAFSFFHSSFVKACSKFLGENHPKLEIVKKGKARRQDFTYGDLDDEIIPYCEKEVELTVELMNTFRGILYGAGIIIRQWYGPGSIASFFLKEQGVQKHMSVAPEEVRAAAQFAYAAGRFEPFKLGRQARKVWGLDINSAYPEAMTYLPSLSNGEWVHVDNPTRLAHFGVYRVSSIAPSSSLFSRPAGPLFHRDRRHRISFPWISNGWFWTPETATIWKNPNYTIHEGWEFREHSDIRPFEWVRDMFAKRRQWQREGNTAEYALKLGLNSLYGKMAQRVGWNKKTNTPPQWHQLEWAGWVTSYTRAKLYVMMQRLGLDSIVAVETDGIYTIRDPAEIGIASGKGLGEWDINEYTDVVYIQSGLAWIKKDGSDDWEFKYRGLDPDSLTIERVINHLHSLGKEVEWSSPESKLIATTSRFVGVGAALMSKDFDTTFRRWEKMRREVKLGGDGKRLHLEQACRACKDGISPGDDYHDLFSSLPNGEMSTAHSLPWIQNNEEAPWRTDVEYVTELLQDV